MTNDHWEGFAALSDATNDAQCEQFRDEKFEYRKNTKRLYLLSYCENSQKQEINKTKKKKCAAADLQRYKWYIDRYRAYL